MFRWSQRAQFQRFHPQLLLQQLLPGVIASLVDMSAENLPRECWSHVLDGFFRGKKVIYRDKVYRVNAAIVSIEKTVIVETL